MKYQHLTLIKRQRNISLIRYKLKHTKTTFQALGNIYHISKQRAHELFYLYQELYRNQN